MFLVAHPAYSDEPAPASAPIAAEAEYSRQRVGFTKVTDSDGSRWTKPYQGNADHALDPPAFYEAVGHPEHARYYRQRTRKKFAIVLPSVFALLAGAALTVAGGVLGVAHPFCRAQDHYANCIDADTQPNAPMLGVGLTLFVGGVAGVSYGSTIHRLPTNSTENFSLARDHNHGLRKRLALPPIPDDATVPNENETPVPLVPKREVPADRPARLGPQNL